MFKIKKKRGSLNFDDPTWFLVVICCIVIATIFYGHNIDIKNKTAELTSELDDIESTTYNNKTDILYDLEKINSKDGSIFKIQKNIKEINKVEENSDGVIYNIDYRLTQSGQELFQGNKIITVKINNNK